MLYKKPEKNLKDQNKLWRQSSNTIWSSTGYLQVFYPETTLPRKMRNLLVLTLAITSIATSALADFTKIHNTAHCCRSSSIRIGSIGNNGAESPSDCQSACQENEDCDYFSHSDRWKNCAFCSTCYLTTTGNAAEYTSWQNNDRVPSYSKLAETECESSTTIAGAGSYLGGYSSLGLAKLACSTNNACKGIYDPGCDGFRYYLCSEDLRNSNEFTWNGSEWMGDCAWNKVTT